ncbi:TspO/MBR family protein [Chengkuizengella marina]|uniref:Tryptophan-rich sensory protein n=1 Tax=Chengkuizengella marina TaxID=2507566 RepID=A0A6N9Q532_9BACL|nr:TspO/MBR family protein [Chengkuizengella marina]NBI29880.1 tryptophan-rich sensory protein [Chengkuizengella marina]
MSLLLSISIVFTLAILGNIFVGDALTVWYAQLNKPWYLVPLWFFIIVGILYYIMGGIILYRQINRFTESKLRKNALTLTLIMLIGNELWNYLFFGLESIFLGFISLFPFILIVSLLAIILKKMDVFSFKILLPYIFWLIYDLIWTFGLYMQN